MRARRAASGRIMQGVAALLLALASAGCESTPELQSQRSYSRDGISFKYPGNWSVTEGDVPPENSKFRYLFVESPGSAIIIVQRYKPPMDLSVQEFAAEFHRKAMGETEKIALGPVQPFTVSSGDTGAVSSVVGGTRLEGVEQSFSIAIADERVPHKFRAFKVDTAASSAFLIAQAATEDWDLVGPGFDLVLGSFQVE